MSNEIERIPVDGSLREKYRKLEHEYNLLVKDQYHKDYQFENQKKALENIKKTLERYERENKALRTLLELWI